MTDRFTLDRSYRARLEEVWALWTTADGIESWWGPEGFSVAVREIDLRAGGRLVYAMTADPGPTRDWMVGQGMPVTTQVTLVFTDVTPHRRLAWETEVDFVPGHAPYPVATEVALRTEGEMVHMTLTSDAMHDAEWTGRARAGHESQLRKLAARLGA